MISPILQPQFDIPETPPKVPYSIERLNSDLAIFLATSEWRSEARQNSSISTWKLSLASHRHSTVSVETCNLQLRYRPFHPMPSPSLSQTEAMAKFTKVTKVTKPHNQKTSRLTNASKHTMENASDSQANTPAKAEPGRSSPEKNQFSLNFQKFSSLEEACQCLQIAKDIASMENCLRKLPQKRVSDETLALQVSPKEVAAIKRALQMPSKVLDILHLINSETDRQAVRQAISYIEGIEKLRGQVDKLPKEARQELFRAHDWLCGAYEAGADGS